MNADGSGLGGAPVSACLLAVLTGGIFVRRGMLDVLLWHAYDQSGDADATDGQTGDVEVGP